MREGKERKEAERWNLDRTREPSQKKGIMGAGGRGTICGPHNVLQNGDDPFWSLLWWRLSSCSMQLVADGLHSQMCCCFWCSLSWSTLVFLELHTPFLLELFYLYRKPRLSVLSLHGHSFFEFWPIQTSSTPLFWKDSKESLKKVSLEWNPRAGELAVRLESCLKENGEEKGKQPCCGVSQ